MFEKAKPEDWVIVNTDEKGDKKHYGFKVWPLAGYRLDLFSVYGDSLQDAIDILLNYLKENKYHNCFTAEQINKKYVEETGYEIKLNPEKYKLTSEQVKDLSNEEAYKLLDEEKENELYYDYLSNYIRNDNDEIFVYNENFQIWDWPKDYASPESVK